jgi:hypothetical protein
MQAFLIAIVTWLSVNCDLPANYELPTIHYASPSEITYFRYGAFSPTDKEKVAASQQALPAELRNSTVAVYDHKNRAIILPTGWTAITPAEQSMVVHEMVHHLQYVAQFKFACPQEAESAAYKAQNKWLQLFGKSLESEFSLDGFTILANSNCLN